MLEMKFGQAAVSHAFNISTGEAEADQGQHGLHAETNYRASFKKVRATEGNRLKKTKTEIQFKWMCNTGV